MYFSFRYMSNMSIRIFKYIVCVRRLPIGAEIGPKSVGVIVVVVKNNTPH